jgi:hypothetical protein
MVSIVHVYFMCCDVMHLLLCLLLLLHCSYVINVVDTFNV